jgi:hypothetical protein
LRCLLRLLLAALVPGHPFERRHLRRLSGVALPHHPRIEPRAQGGVLWCAGGERWYCWSATVTAFDAASKTLTFDKPQPDRWYTPRQGNLYVLMGVRNALDAEGEWWLDRGTKTLGMKPPGGADPNTRSVEAKRRIYAIDLSGRAHIRIVGIGFRAATSVWTCRVRVEQTIEQLHPGTAYQLSGWLKVSGDNASAMLGISGHGAAEATVKSEDQGWERKTLDFTTGASVTSVTVFIEQKSEAGQAFADNLGLPRSPPAE